MSFEWLATNLLAAWLLPPLDLIVVIALGLALVPRRARLGLALAAAGLVALAALSIPRVGDLLATTLEDSAPPLEAQRARDAGAGAIVVLGGGRNRGALEYGGETLDAASLGRVRYGARLARLTGLPLLVSGGRPDGGGASEADLMAQVLAQEFGVPVRWRETQSINTLEDAHLSATLLAGAGIRRVILVTDASHMRRASGRFRAAGLQVVPAPTNYRAQRVHTPVDWLPSARGLERSSRALREWIGILWSRARGA
ncbi:MAG TPA: YdcF family protein [Burkholderiales bacterium]|nr:YdcF family protein [Burkholderiales bacterium]